MKETIDKLQLAIADPDSPLYGSDLVPLILDLCEEFERASNEIASVLMLMDGLAEQWGDEGVFRRCRDRLRVLIQDGVKGTP